MQTNWARSCNLGYRFDLMTPGSSTFVSYKLFLSLCGIWCRLPWQHRCHSQGHVWRLPLSLSNGEGGGTVVRSFAWLPPCDASQTLWWGHCHRLLKVGVLLQVKHYTENLFACRINRRSTSPCEFSLLFAFSCSLRFIFLKNRGIFSYFEGVIVSM